MPLVRLILALLALPLQLLGRLVAMFSPPQAVSLYAAAWTLAGSPHTAMLALQTIKNALGPEAMLAQAELWMARRPQAEIGAFAGLTALNLGDTAGAADWHDRARRSGHDSTGIADLLGYLLALAADGSQATRLARELSARRDLGPTLARLIREELLWDDFFAGRHDQARRRAEHLLAIQKHLPASAAMWALESLRGRPGAAYAHLMLTEEFPPENRLYWQCLASTALGDPAQTQRLLEQLDAASESAAQAARETILERTARPCA